MIVLYYLSTNPSVDRTLWPLFEKGNNSIIIHFHGIA